MAACTLDGNGFVFSQSVRKTTGKLKEWVLDEAKIAEALRNMSGHRLDANVYHFDYRTDLTGALCAAVDIDLSRQVMTKSQMNKVMSVVKKPRI